jgi:nitroreductase
LDVLTAIETRSSATKLAEPGPNREQLLAILNAGARAPDHGRLAPWRFVVLEGPARGKLGEAMAQSLRRRFPDAPPEALETERRKPERAPLLVVVAASPQPHVKVPQIEQVLAVGAAVQNMLLAAQALGFGAMWKTGAVAYDAAAKQALGLAETDQIIAILYLGTALARAPQRPADAERVTRWL